MNWTVLVNKFPTAWERFCQYIYKTVDTVETVHVYPTHVAFYGCSVLDGEAYYFVNSEKLYEFFDQEELRVFIVPVRPSFGWVIVDVSKGVAIDASNEVISTRVEAEGFVFEKAFELLEEKLKK